MARSISLVDVLPTEPVTATTLPRTRARAAAPSRSRASKTSSTINSGASSRIPSGTRDTSAAPAPATITEAEPVTGLKELKQQVSIMRTKLKKAEKQLAELPEGESNPVLEADIAELKARHDAAQAIFNAAEAEKAAAAAQQGIDLKQLKIDAAMARAAVTKAERALSKAEDDHKQTLEEELLAARTEAEKLNSTLERFSE